MVNPTIVAMISGGVDSTYMLFKLLNETDYHIHAHHINIKNSIEKRWKKEKESVSQILTYCRNKYRDFEYSESSFELYNFCHTGSDAALQLFVGARVAQNMRATSVSVAIGCNKDEYESFQEIPQETGPLEGSNTAMLRAAIGYYMKQDRDRINDVPMFPIIEDTKYEIIKRLPKKLANLTWSCRTPNKGVECNKCHSCVARNKVENLIQLKENGNNRSVKLIPVPTLNRIVGINEALIYDSTTGNKLIVSIDALKVIDECYAGTTWHRLIDLYGNEKIEPLLEKLVEKQLVIPQNKKPLKINYLPEDKYIEQGRLISDLRLNVTENCNLDCSYCLERQSNVFNQRRIMSWDIAKLCIDKFISLLRKNRRYRVPIRFFGGEPLLNWKLVRKALEYLSDVDMEGLKPDYLINTNGTIMNDEMAAFLRDHNVHVSVSLDGLGDRHDTLRRFRNGGGSFHIINKNITNLLNKKCRVSLSIVLSDQNYGHLKELIDYVEEKNIESNNKMGIGLTVLCGCNKKGFDTLSIERKIDYIEEALKYAKNKNVPIETGTLYFGIMRLMHNRHSGGHCGGAGNELSIDPEGNIYSCYGSEKILGTIYDLKSVFINKDYKRLARKRLGNLAECEGCKIEAFCLGGCDVDNALEMQLKGDRKQHLACEFRKKSFDSLARTIIIS